MKKIILLFCCTILVSCELLDTSAGIFQDRNKYLRHTNLHKGKEGSETLTPGDTVVYAVGVEFARSYDWQRDTAYSKEPFNLVVFKNGKIDAEYSSLTNRFISSDADHHHLINGRLYTDFDTGSSMIWQKDGKEIFRYNKSEKIKGLLIDDEGDVYTLGQNLRIGGFTLRKNGQPVFSKNTGYIVGDIYYASRLHGALFKYEEDLCFIYYTLSEGMKEPIYFWVKAGREEKIDPPKGYPYITDAIISKNKKIILYSNGKYGTRVFNNGKEIYFQNYPFALFKKIRIIESGEHIYMIGEVNSTAIWNEEGLLINTIKEEKKIVDFYVDGKQTALPIYDLNDNLHSVLLNGKHYKIGGDRHLMSGFCGYIKGKKFYMAISPHKSKLNPELWINGKFQEVRFNGYFTCIEVVTK